MKALDILEMQVEKHKFLSTLTKQSFYLEYKGFGIHESRCKVHLFQKDGFSLVFFEDIGEGTSVTNASEQIAQMVLDIHNLDFSNTAWFEFYRYKEKAADFDRIFYVMKNNKISQPNWVPMQDAIFIKFFSKELL